MRRISFDSILLPALITPFIMAYRLSWKETPYWLFGLIFLLILLYLVLDLSKLKEILYFRLKQILLWTLIITVIGSAFISAIIVRHQAHPIYMIHDMPLQQEIAIRFFLDGKNPYSETYFNTFLEQWHYSESKVNPALYHFVLLPFYILFAIPFYFLSLSFFGFFDARIPLLFLFLGLLALGSFLVRQRREKLLFLILLAFNPAMLPYILEGRSDMFMFPFLFLGFFLLEKRRYALSGVPIGLAFATKQSAWPLFPFYILFLFFKTKGISKTLVSLVVFIFTFALITLPFLAWDPKAFWDSTIGYLSGSTSNSYPVSGYGLGSLLHQLGVIKDVYAYYPFQIWQALLAIPLFILLARLLKNKPTVSRLILFYGIFLFVFWYFSRYFNNSHLAYISLIFITAYFWPEDQKGSV